MHVLSLVSITSDLSLITVQLNTLKAQQDRFTSLIDQINKNFDNALLEQKKHLDACGSLAQYPCERMLLLANACSTLREHLNTLEDKRNILCEYVIVEDEKLNELRGYDGKYIDVSDALMIAERIERMKSRPPRLLERTNRLFTQIEASLKSILPLIAKPSSSEANPVATAPSAAATDGTDPKTTTENQPGRAGFFAEGNNGATAPSGAQTAACKLA